MGEDKQMISIRNYNNVDDQAPPTNRPAQADSSAQS